MIPVKYTRPPALSIAAAKGTDATKAGEPLPGLLGIAASPFRAASRYGRFAAARAAQSYSGVGQTPRTRIAADSP